MGESSSLMKDLHVLVLAGGSGTRFWPKSRASKPKQLLKLWNEKSLLENTVARFDGRVPSSQVWIATTEALVQSSVEALANEHQTVNFLGEPAPKNTAACIFWGLSEIRKVNPNAVVAVMPADHFIEDLAAFWKGVNLAIRLARENGGMVTLGIQPNRPDTGFGYIEAIEGAGAASGVHGSKVKQFVEKPDLATAARYIESGRFFWNAGMFFFKVEEGRLAFQRTMPNLVSKFDEVERTGNALSNAYALLAKEDSVSIDYGVMEKAVATGISVSVVPVSCGWNDVGSFTALDEIQAAATSSVVQLDAGSNIVQSDGGLVALLGVNDLIVVRDGAVVLVASKDRAQDVKNLVERVKAQYPELV